MRCLTNGHKALVLVDASLSEIGRACGGTAVPTVGRWRDGTTRPRRKAREALERAYGIPVDAWERDDDVEITKLPQRRSPGRPRKDGSRAQPRKANGHAVDAPKAIATRAKANGRKPARAKDGNAPPPYPTPPDNPSTLDDLRHVLACIRYDLEHRPSTASARSKLRSDEARIIGMIAKLERDAELSEDRYVRNHPAFKMLAKRILEALKPFPDAAQAVVDALS